MNKPYNCPFCNEEMEFSTFKTISDIQYYHYVCPKCKRASYPSEDVRDAEKFCEDLLMNLDKEKDLENMSSEDMKEKIEKEDVIYYAEMLLKEEGTEVCDNPLNIGATGVGIWFTITNAKYPFFIDLTDSYNSRIILSSKEGVEKRGCEEVASFSLKNAELAHLKEILFRERKREETNLEKQFIALVSSMKEDPANS